ncbi:hypothetical protein [Polaribacter sargassicola]|uniref:hypothetical protein n=1 Tax=Polaribacter sargassicola TaxID=2836891 RepID=UPI001F24CE1E|nr:hypothetical protein [Polaribacter sp. DS7-9]MCG1036378.1 hypothetical protein [Polaribacter sp. DS7-9]
MKKLKIIFTFFSIFIVFSCTTTSTGTSDLNPEFKIGKNGFEKRLKKGFDFEKLNIGTYYSNKNGISQENGVNLTFTISDFSKYSNSDFFKISKHIKKELQEYLLNLNNYDYVKIIYNRVYKEDGLEKTSSVKIKLKL